MVLIKNTNFGGTGVQPLLPPVSKSFDQKDGCVIMKAENAA
jgi:hypothetical protein